MNIEEQENGPQSVASHPPGSLGTFEPAVLPPVVGERTNGWVEGDEPRESDDADETVFTVLAGRARTHATAHLWLTAAIGGIDAAALMFGRPALWWVAAACAAVSAYAVWGLADRALAEQSGKRWRPMLLRGIMALALIVGVVAALAAAIGLLGVALGKSPPTG